MGVKLMRGFCEEVLLILPQQDTYEFRGDFVQGPLNRTFNVITEYLRGLDMKVFCFNSNDLAVYLYHKRKLEYVHWINAYIKADLAFARRGHVVDGADIPDGRVYRTFEDLWHEKIPVPLKFTEAERFDIARKRHRALTTDIINDFRFVVTMETIGNEEFKVRKGNKNDERMVWRWISISDKFEAFLSGTPIPIKEITNYSFAGYPLDRWNVEEALRCV
jgi:hypothetical protein